MLPYKPEFTGEAGRHCWTLVSNERPERPSSLKLGDPLSADHAATVAPMAPSPPTTVVEVNLLGVSSGFSSDIDTTTFPMCTARVIILTARDMLPCVKEMFVMGCMVSVADRMLRR